ncbi:hypothetical protein [Rhizobium sp. GN54]|nr:hypothetical protein [Rhizobium sp. GN54]
MDHVFFCAAWIILAWAWCCPENVGRWLAKIDAARRMEDKP